MNLTLYQISDQYLQDVAKLNELDIDDQTFADTLESLSGELEVKATNVAMFVRNLEASAEAIKQAEDAMYARRKALENKAERLRDYLFQNMQRTGISKIECPYFAITIKKNIPAVVVAPDAQIPDEYWRQPPRELDKVKIKSDLKAGVVIDGCRLESKLRVDIK